VDVQQVVAAFCRHDMYGVDSASFSCCFAGTWSG